jgi:hypothetical protein
MNKRAVGELARLNPEILGRPLASAGKSGLAPNSGRNARANGVLDFFGYFFDTAWEIFFLIF